MKRRRRRQTAQPPRQPATTRITKQLEDPGATEHETPAWLFRDADQNGPWPLTEEAFLKHIMPKLRDFETMTWAQITCPDNRASVRYHPPLVPPGVHVMKKPLLALALAALSYGGATGTQRGAGEAWTGRP